MIRFCVIGIWVLAVAYRALVLGLPFYQEPTNKNLWVNLASGLASDLSVAAALTGFFMILSKSLPHRLASGFIALLFAAIFFSMAVHLRYVEHFGMTFRTFHLASLKTGDVWGAGLGMLFQSWRVQVLSLVTFVGTVAATLVLPSNKVSKSLLTIVGVLVVAACFQSLMINLRFHPDVHAELRYNPFTALAMVSQSHSFKTVAKPSDSDLKGLRRYLNGSRTFADVGSDFPFWQAKLAESPQNPKWRDSEYELKSLINSQDNWNIVLLVSESLRAHELSSFGAKGQILDPELNKIVHNSVSFTNVISGGLRTHAGQVLSMCSVYVVFDFGLLNAAPMHNATCLSDIFSQHGYETHFFYGADNNFDNQRDFYTKHRMKYIVGGNDFPKMTPHAGWGVSDKALFDKAVDDLKQSKSPFFATVLTLSNHAPYKLPSDAPSEIKNSKFDVKRQQIQYVDWSTGYFFDRLKKEIPNTIFIMVADHGVFWDEGLMSQIPSYQTLSQVARIPFIIHVPGQSKSIKIDELASNVDLAPTLLSLLGWNNTYQQFVGQNIFSRTGPVYLDWMSKLLEINGPDKEITKIPDQDEEGLAALLQLNLLAPPG